MNLAALRTRVYRLLGESEASPLIWPNAQVDRAINDAYVDMARDSGALEQRITVRSVASQADYELPRTAGPVLRVAYDDYMLRPDTSMSLDRVAPGWQDETGTPERWIKSRARYSKFRLYKKPVVTGPGGETSGDYGRIVRFETTGVTINVNYEYGRLCTMIGENVVFTANSAYGLCRSLKFGQDNISVWTKRNPTQLVADTDLPELPAYAHQGIAFRAAEGLLRLERDGRNEQLASIYEAVADEYESHLRMLVSARLPERITAPSYPDNYDRTRWFNRNTEIPQPEA